MAEFTLFGLPLLGDEEFLSLWDLVSPPQGTAYAQASDGAAVLTWHIRLPAPQGRTAADQARTLLQDRLAQVEAQQADLTLIEERLDTLARDAMAPVPAQAYGAAAGAAENELWATIAALQVPAMAFAAQPQLETLYRRLYQEAQALLAQFRQALSSGARVETEAGGKRVAVTAVDASGDFRTAWALDVTPDEMLLHLEAIRLAMASRQALLKLVTVVVSGALALAAKVSVPGGPLLLIPAVYHYVRDVLRTWRQVVEDVRIG